MTDALPAPWDAFLTEIDASLQRAIELHCLGGFVLHARFDLPRPTYDVDFIVAIPNDAPLQLVALAGKGTPLAKKHNLYLDKVNLGFYPDDYEDRLTDLATPQFHSLKLRAMEPHDLVLAKLNRNSPKDQYDVRFLAEKGQLEASVLEARYREHLRPYLLTTERHDLTLSIWMETIREVEQQRDAFRTNQRREKGDSER
jgi:hypothetical protein